MTRINLLPWRETLRKERQRQFYTVAGGAGILMVLIVFYIHMHIGGLFGEGGLIGAQMARNKYIESEIAKVEAKITEITGLKSEKRQLLARMNIIQQLQSRRPEIVHIFDELMRRLPEGVYLANVKQEGTSIQIEGIAQSNSRVSEYMRNLEQSDWLENPRLAVVEANSQALSRTSVFTLFVNQVKHDTESADDEGAEA
ncbi:MAG: PilN domain-containing protein [Gammaproteobacteria bacterium]